MSDSAVTPAGVRDGEPDALRGLVARRGPAVLAYCAAVCEPAVAPRAAAEAFARFRGAVAAAEEPGALAPEPLLLGATRHAAASMARVAASPGAGLRRLLGDRGANETCAMVPTLLAAQADGMLSPDDQDRLRRHLDRHPACRAIEAGFRTAEQRYATPPDRAIPPPAERLILTALVAAAPLAPGVDASGVLSTGRTEEEDAVAAAQATQDWAAADVAAALAAADAADVATGAPEPLAEDEPLEPEPSGPEATAVVAFDEPDDEDDWTDEHGLEPDAAAQTDEHPLEPGPRAAAPDPYALGTDAPTSTADASDAAPDPFALEADDPELEEEHDDGTTAMAPVAPHPDAAVVVPDEGFEDDDELVDDEDPDAEPATAVHAAVADADPAERRSLRERLHVPDEQDHGPFFRFILPGAAIVVALLIAAIVAGVFDGDDAEPEPGGAAPAARTVQPASAVVEPSALAAPEAGDEEPVTTPRTTPRKRSRSASTAAATSTATTSATGAATQAAAAAPTRSQSRPAAATPAPAAPRRSSPARTPERSTKDAERTDASPSLPGTATQPANDPADEPVFTPGDAATTP